jgi:small-conductance mechanosensitive channel
MKLRLALLILFFLKFSLSGFALQDNVPQKKSLAVQADSLNDNKFQDLIKESNEMRILDSLQKLELQKQIDQLRESNSFERQRLQLELLQLASKDSLRRVAEKKQIDSLKKTLVGYPVVPFNDTLLTIYIKSGSSKPKERAANFASKVQVLYEDDFLEIDSILLDESDYTVDIVYGDIIITSISDMDAQWEDRSKLEIARDYQQRIKEAIFKEREERSFIKTLSRIGLVLLITSFIALLIFGIGKLYRYAERLIIAQKNKRIKDLTIQDYTLVSSQQGLRLLLSALNFVKWALIFLLLFLTLPLVFSVFPFTNSWAERLFSIVWTPFRSLFIAIWNYFPNMVTILVIYFVMKYFIRMVKYIFGEIDSGKLEINGFHRDWASPTFSIVKFLLYAFMLILIFPLLPGSDSNIFKGVSVFIGILFSLGSSSAIANMVAGLVITYMRPFKIGDKIKTGNVTGVVIEKTLLVTRLRTILNEEITIPNSAILSGNTTNYSTFSETGVIVHVSVGVGYDVPWKKVHESLLEAASKIDVILKTPPPFVLQTGLDDFYASYRLCVYVSDPRMEGVIVSLMNQRIQDVFAAKNIEMTSPHYVANRNGDDSTIPKGEV